MASAKGSSDCCPVDIEWLKEEAIAMAGPGTPRHALIAGGSGLIGSNLLVLLGASPGCERIRVLDMRPPSRKVIEGFEDKVDFVHCRFGSASHESLLAAMKDVDCVFSVFTPHVQTATTEEFMASNIDGMEQITRACVEAGVARLVHVSSIAVSNHFVNSIEQKESDPLPKIEDYQSPYDLSKRRGENIVLEANREGTIATCSLRAGGVFLSPWDFSFRNLWPVIPGIIFMPIGQKIDFIDGRDVVRGLLLAAQALETRPAGVAGEAFWLTQGTSVAPGEVARMAGNYMGYPFVTLPDSIVVPVSFFAWIYYHFRLALGLRVPGVPPHRFANMCFYTKTFDNSKIRETLGFQPKFTLKDSVVRIVDLYIRETGVSRGPRRCISFLVTMVLAVVALIGLYAKAPLAIVSMAS
eukprot:CAMPEP_0115303962 /NCGR_PEP_ID=MMETSP0270-20121206/71200_1 /TAXON_ID=71861 /ORGANISM="Scrippsiella trochoidea, Strain CCMP3099" /LENGTH=410 /DNA_ID=CAMNT_0002721999 /DNA_START=56 /DNA_END=1288 /DNA_ORIENTATION=+